MSVLSNYFIRFTEPYDLELWSTVRLPFEPKGWLKQMREDLRSALTHMRPEPNLVLESIYISKEPGYFDTENVLLYNVGPSYLKHLCKNGLSFRHLSQNPPTTQAPINDRYHHYQRYKLVPKSSVSIGMNDTEAIAKWNNLICPSLTTETRPHVFWSLMRQHPIETSEVPFQHNFGIDLILKVPFSRPINAVALIKPLLDGIISSFHSHDGSNLSLVSSRLADLTGIKESTITTLLMESKMAVLGQRCLIHPRVQGIQWNPADHLCSEVNLVVQYENISDWILSGLLKPTRVNT